MITLTTVGDYSAVKSKLNRILQEVNDKKTSQAVGKNNIVTRTDVTVKDYEKGNVFLDLGNSVGHPSFTTRKKDVRQFLSSQKSQKAYEAIRSIWFRNDYFLVGAGQIRKTFNSGSEVRSNSWCQLFRKANRT